MEKKDDFQAPERAALPRETVSPKGLPERQEAGNRVTEAGAAGSAKEIEAQIRALFDKSRFRANFLPFQIDSIQCGRCQISLQIEEADHADDLGEVHGGVLAALADAVLVITAASVGEAARPVSLSLDFINNADFGTTVRMTGVIRHHGRTTMVVSGEMYDECGRMLATMQATMMNTGTIQNVPRQW